MKIYTLNGLTFKYREGNQPKGAVEVKPVAKKQGKAPKNKGGRPRKNKEAAPAKDKEAASHGDPKSDERSADR